MLEFWTICFVQNMVETKASESGFHAAEPDIQARFPINEEVPSRTLARTCRLHSSYFEGHNCVTSFSSDIEWT
jgi:hypothetical protein